MPVAVQRPPGTDRWVLPYADLVTLLLAFFVTLYAVSRVDLERLEPASAALRVAFDGAQGEASQPGGPPQLVTEPHVVAPNPLDVVTSRMQTAITGTGLDGKVELTRDDRGVVLSLPEAAAFDSGQAELTARSSDLLLQVGHELRALSHAIRIEGHTDNRPVSGSRFRSNWELSTARASAVVALFIERAGVAPARLSAAGYGEYHPRGPNTTAAERALNRRVDIVILAAGGPR